MESSRREGPKEWQYLMLRREGKIFSFLLQNQKAVEIHCEKADEISRLGNVYIGRIKNIAKNIQAAFVEIAPGEVCYLPLEDLKHPVFTKKGSSKSAQAGDELLVQINREGMKTKFPSVTTQISLHGKYAVLTRGKEQTGVSKKLPIEIREELVRFADRILEENGELEGPEAGAAGTEPKKGNGREWSWILRTNAGAASREQLKAELLRLKEQYETLMRQAFYRTCFSCLLKTPPAYLNRLSDLYDSSVHEFLTDDEALYQEMREYLTEYQPEDLSKLAFYEDELLPMHKLYSLEHQLSQALRERVWMDSGGYLVIQPTEALTVIDVNTGKYEGGKNKEKTFLKINLQAAREVARQLRLRNLSGIIIVDFINMEKQESKKELLSALEGFLREDPVHATLVDMTKLSLVEITRQKKEKPLAESVGDWKTT